MKNHHFLMLKIAMLKATLGLSIRFLSVSLLLVGFNHVALAIGLGEIEVKSQLGEPLRAKINVHGINSLADEACFKLTSAADGSDYLKSANFKLANLLDGEAVLSVSSRQLINDPIINLSISTQCDNIVRRDYVLLLDPPIGNEAEITVIATETNKAAANDMIPSRDKRLSAIQSDIDHDISGVTTSRPTTKESTKAKLNNKNSIAANTTSKLGSMNIPMPAAGTPPLRARIERVLNDDTPLTKVAKDSNATTKTSSNSLLDKSEVKKNNNQASRLSLSGSHLNDDNTSKTNHQLNLHLDTQLHVTPSSDPRAFAAEAEVQDEMTVMNNRLAHLNNQMAALQKRNGDLESAAKTNSTGIQKVAPQVIEESNIWHWATYLLGAALLAIGLLVGEKWRRHQLSLKLARADNWTYIEENPLEDSDLTKLFNTDDLYGDVVHNIGIGSVKVEGSQTEINNEENTAQNEPVKSNLSAKEFEFTPIKPAFVMNKIESVVVQEDILDHADVFLSHGRNGLAVQLLQNHLLEHPKRSVTVWLFLLDLLAKEGLEDDYQLATAECKKHFNIAIPDYAMPTAQTDQSLESFKVLISHLTSVWHTKEAVSFLDSLIYNNRMQARSGFNQCTFEELALLKSIAQVHEKTAEIIPLFQTAPTIRELTKPKIVATKPQQDTTTKISGIDVTKKVAANEVMTMPPILLDLDTSDTLADNDIAQHQEEAEHDFGFNLVEWK